MKKPEDKLMVWIPDLQEDTEMVTALDLQVVDMEMGLIRGHLVVDMAKMGSMGIVLWIGEPFKATITMDMQTTTSQICWMKQTKC